MTKSSAARRATLAGFAAVATVGLVFATAAPAMAAGRSLPAGDRLFSIECDAAYVLEPQLFSVDAATAAITKVGEGTYPTSNESCAFQAAYNAKTGVSYFVDYLDFLPIASTVLSTIDVTTGQSAIVGNFTIVGEPNAIPFVISIAIGPDGTAYAIDDDDYLYSLNLSNAQLTGIAQVDAVGGFRAFGSDPRSGVFYIASSDFLYTLDVATGLATQVYEMNFDGEVNARSLQVDSSGVVWVSSSPEGPAELWSTTNSAAAESYSGQFLEDGTIVYTTSLLLIPAPALAATGGEASPIALIAGLGILTLGGALVLLRRRAATA